MGHIQKDLIVMVGNLFIIMLASRYYYFVRKNIKKKTSRRYASEILLKHKLGIVLVVPVFLYVITNLITKGEGTFLDELFGKTTYIEFIGVLLTMVLTLEIYKISEIIEQDRKKIMVLNETRDVYVKTKENMYLQSKILEIFITYIEIPDLNELVKHIGGQPHILFGNKTMTQEEILERIKENNASIIGTTQTSEIKHITHNYVNVLKELNENLQEYVELGIINLYIETVQYSSNYLFYGGNKKNPTRENIVGGIKRGMLESTVKGVMDCMYDLSLEYNNYYEENIREWEYPDFNISNDLYEKINKYKMIKDIEVKGIKDGTGDYTKEIMEGREVIENSKWVEHIKYGRYTLDEIENNDVSEGLQQYLDGHNMNKTSNKLPKNVIPLFRDKFTEK